MSNNQLELIRSYCDTSHYRLTDSEKNILCRILENPSRYNGFESKLHKETDSGRNYRDTWDSLTEWQYRIIIDSQLKIKERYRHSSDGYVQDQYWDWSNAYEITDIRKILKILQEIESEL